MLFALMLTAVLLAALVTATDVHVHWYKLLSRLTCVARAKTGLLLLLKLPQLFPIMHHQVMHGCRQNLADAMRQDEKVDRKIARNQNQFEALDFNAAVSDTRMSPASAFVATIRGNISTTSVLH